MTQSKHDTNNWEIITHEDMSVTSAFDKRLIPRAMCRGGQNHASTAAIDVQ